jgi:hypothetical protein
MSRNKFNVNNRSAELAQARVAQRLSLCGASNVSLANSFGAGEQDSRTPKNFTTYLGLLYITYYLISHSPIPIGLTLLNPVSRKNLWFRCEGSTKKPGCSPPKVLPYYLLPITYYLLPITYYLLPITYYP